MASYLWQHCGGASAEKSKSESHLLIMMEYRHHSTTTDHHTTHLLTWSSVIGGHLLWGQQNLPCRSFESWQSLLHRCQLMICITQYGNLGTLWKLTSHAARWHYSKSDRYENNKRVRTEAGMGRLSPRVRGPNLHFVRGSNFASASE